jgi:hypothetical protein
VMRLCSRADDACQDIKMAGASLLVAIERAATVDEALAIRERIREAVNLLESVENSALRKADAL